MSWHGPNSESDEGSEFDYNGHTAEEDEEDPDIDFNRASSGGRVEGLKTKREKFFPSERVNIPRDIYSKMAEWGQQIVAIQRENKLIKEQKEAKAKEECMKTGEDYVGPLPYITEKEVKSERLNRRNPLKFMDEMSSRIKGSIMNYMENGNNPRAMSQAEKDAIINWRQTSLFDNLEGEQNLQIYDYTEPNLELLRSFNVPGLLAVDIEYGHTRPCVPATIQINSWTCGSLIIYMEVPQRADMKILKQIFENPEILKVGFGITNDISVLKIMGIFPVGLIDIQYNIKKLFGLDQSPGLANVFEFFTGHKASKEERIALFEKRENGKLPELSRLYAITDAIMHFTCYYELIIKVLGDLKGDALQERKSFLLAKFNDYYANWTSEQVFSQTSALALTDKQDAYFKARNLEFKKGFDRIKSIIGPEQYRLITSIDEYRERMYLRNGLLSKHELLPNGLVFDLSEDPPNDLPSIEKRIKNWREEILIKPKDGKPHKVFEGPLKDICVLNGHNLLKLIKGTSSVDELVNRICLRCRQRFCLMFKFCEGKAAIMVGNGFGIRPLKRGLRIQGRR